MRTRLTALFIAIAATALADGGKAGKGQMAGKTAPLVALRDVKDRMVFLRDLVGAQARPQTKKKAIVLDFFGTFCGPCKRELPHILELNERWKDKGVEVLLIGYGESPDTLAEFVTAQNIPLRVLSDRYGLASKQYAVSSLPRVLVVGGDGVVKEDLVGDHEDLVNQLDKLLGVLTSGGA